MVGVVSPTVGSWDESAYYKPYAVRDEESNRWLLWYNGRHGAPEYSKRQVQPRLRASCQGMSVSNV